MAGEAARLRRRRQRDAVAGSRLPLHARSPAAGSARGRAASLAAVQDRRDADRNRDIAALEAGSDYCLTGAW